MEIKTKEEQENDLYAGLNNRTGKPAAITCVLAETLRPAGGGEI